MIEDLELKSEIVKKWNVVRTFCKGVHRSYYVPGGGQINETPPESFFNLPFILAFCILDEVLEIFIQQKVFSITKKKRFLGDRMCASKQTLKWINYDLVYEGKEARNDLAHEAKLLDKIMCMKYIAAIEAELRGWNVF